MTHDPDRIVSLFSLGFELDERIEERLKDLKHSGQTPDEALPGLAVAGDGWHPDRFWDWVSGHGEADAVASPAGDGSRGPSGRLGAAGTQARRGAGAGSRELSASPLQEGAVTAPREMTLVHTRLSTVCP